MGNVCTMSGVAILGKYSLRNCRAVFKCKCGLVWLRRIDEAIFDCPACPDCKAPKDDSELINMEFDYK